MGSEFFNKVQYGVENPAARGTPVVCTDMFIGQMPAVKTDRVPVFPKEHFGVRADSMRNVIHQYLYTNTLASEHGAFQHLPLLGSALKGAVEAAEQTPDQDDYLWAQTPSLTAANAPDSFTLRFGDDVQAWVAEYAMFERIRMSCQIAQGADASPVNLEADFFARQLATTTFTAGLTPPVLEPLNGKLARLYVDATWAAVGSTELTNLLRNFDIEITTGVHPKFAGSAAKTFNQHAEGVIGVTATFDLEGGSSVNTLLGIQQAGTFKVARLEITGSQIGTGDSHTFQLDIGGAFEDAQAIASSENGDNIGTFVLRGYYDLTGAKLLQWNVTTNSNTY